MTCKPEDTSVDLQARVAATCSQEADGCRGLRRASELASRTSGWASVDSVCKAFSTKQTVLKIDSASVWGSL